jgi:hypothetical protein
MLSPSQQQVRLRKFIYIGGILLLFTASLLLRTAIIEPNATRLQLREQMRGEGSLTDSGIRLMLTGSRGLVNCYLWLSAIEKQKKHEWNELDLLVRSLTKLQPHFLSPWLFQSWNLAFNVSVECDQPRDKYYYISRGIELLAEGERRNQGSDNPDPELRFPGSPEMRHNIGFFYQLKIGQSDDQNVMRCFFDMSSIDPAERDADALSGATKAGRSVDLRKFRLFCEKHPRLVRRLWEKLGYDDPEAVVAFLAENKELPSRFKKPAAVQPGAQPEKTPLEVPEKQFPVLPRDLAEATGREFAGEDFNLFTACRYWYAYAQKDLPPASDRPGVDEPPIDLRKYRQPRMSTYIFRGYPARGQAYVAENLEKEGFFDKDGWQIKKWFDADRSPGAAEVRVATESKYWALPAWKAAHEMYIDYGLKNGMYHTSTEHARLMDLAMQFSRRFGLKPASPPPMWRPNQVPAGAGPGYDAYRNLYWGSIHAQTANYENRLYEAEAESTPQAVLAHKLFFQADRLRRFEDAPELALEKYEQAWPIWLDIMLSHPKFRNNGTMQEDIYEIELKYSRLLQKENEAKVFHPVLVGLAQMALWPPLPLLPDPALKAPADWAASATDVLQATGLSGSKEVQEWLGQLRGPYEVRRAFAKETLDGLNLIRRSRGPFQLLVYEPRPEQDPTGSGTKQLEPEALRQVVTWATTLDFGPYAALREALLTQVSRALTEVQKERILATHPIKGPWSWPTPKDAVAAASVPWQPLIPDEAIRAVRDRFNLGPLGSVVPPPGMPPGMQRPPQPQPVTPNVGN